MINAFNVLTEFRFEIGGAVANSKVLQNEVGKISQAADETMFAFRRMGIGIAAQLGLGTGGLIGFLYSAVEASEKFAASQRSLANIFLSNQQLFGSQGITFNQAMTQSSRIMDEIIQKAREFALDPNELMSQTKSIAPMLLSHNLDDANLKRSIDIARGLMKSAPTLAIDPGMIGSQLVSLVMGRAELNNTLFQRLMSETAPFKDAGITSSKKYNDMAPEKRIELLRKALLQFGSNADILRGNMMSLNGQLQVFSSLVKGQFSIFKNIGDALGRPLKMMLFQVNQYLMKEGKQIADTFAKIILDLVKSPEKLFVTIRQLQRLQSDTKSAGKIFGIIGSLQLVTLAMRFFGVTLSGVLAPALRFLGIAGMSIGAVFIKILPFLGRFAVFMARFVFAPLLALTFLMQSISRAMAKAEVFNAKWLLDNLPRIMELFARLKGALSLIFLPITLAIEGLSDIIAWFFRLDITGGVALSLFELLVDFMEKLGGAMLSLMAIVSGLVMAIIQAVADLVKLNFNGLPARLQSAFVDGFDSFKQRYTPTVGENQDEPVSTKNTYIDRIEINNSFKEQMEPDRIAFTLRDQLLKAALNPQQASGRSQRSALVGN